MRKEPSRLMEYGEFLENHPIDVSQYYTMKTHRRNGLYSIAPLEFQIMYYVTKNNWEWRVVDRIQTDQMAGSIEEQVKKRSQQPWGLCKFPILVEIMAEHGIDLDDFEFKLRQTILQNVIFAHRVVCDTVDMFGEQVVNQAIADDVAFIQELTKTIRQVLSAPPEEKETEEPSNVVSIWGKPRND